MKKISSILFSLLIVLFVCTFLNSCKNDINTVESNYKIVDLINGEYKVKIQLSHNNLELLETYDENSFKLTILNSLNNHDHHDHHDHHDDYFMDDPLINEIDDNLPEIEVIDSNTSTQSYLIELISETLVQPLTNIEFRGCSLSNGSSVYHGYCWRSRYANSCGGATYSPCYPSSEATISSWHWHPY